MAHPWRAFTNRSQLDQQVDQVKQKSNFSNRPSTIFFSNHSFSGLCSRDWIKNWTMPWSEDSSKARSIRDLIRRLTMTSSNQSTARKSSSSGFKRTTDFIYNDQNLFKWTLTNKLNQDHLTRVFVPQVFLEQAQTCTFSCQWCLLKTISCMALPIMVSSPYCITKLIQTVNKTDPNGV